VPHPISIFTCIEPCIDPADTIVPVPLLPTRYLRVLSHSICRYCSCPSCYLILFTLTVFVPLLCHLNSVLPHCTSSFITNSSYSYFVNHCCHTIEFCPSYTLAVPLLKYFLGLLPSTVLIVLTVCIMGCDL
jgi:hypothetical protein